MRGSNLPPSESQGNFSTPEPRPLSTLDESILNERPASLNHPPSHSMPVLSKEKPLVHSQLKLPGELTQEAREPHTLLWALHSLLSAWRGEANHWENTLFVSLLRQNSFQCRWGVLTDAGSLVLSEARRTLAGEAPDGVDAEELTVMLLGWTLIQILEGQKKRLTVTNHIHRWSLRAKCDYNIQYYDYN